MRSSVGSWVAWTQSSLQADATARPLKEKGSLRHFRSEAAALAALADANPKYVMRLTVENQQKVEEALLSGRVPPD